MKLSVKEIVIFAMYGAIMYISKILMELLPNIHLVGVFIVAVTVVYRQKAIYPISVYVFLTGLFSGFAIWWIPYLYIWVILWGFVMLIPQKTPSKIKPFIYMAVCALHGFLYGTLYAPFQALVFGFNLEATIAWIIAGIPWDIAHGIGNFFGGLLIMPIITVLKQTKGGKNEKYS